MPNSPPLYPIPSHNEGWLTSGSRLLQRLIPTVVAPAVIALSALVATGAPLRAVQAHEPEPYRVKQPFVARTDAPPVLALGPNRTTASAGQAVRAAELPGFDPRSQLLTALSPLAVTESPPVLPLGPDRTSRSGLRSVQAYEGLAPPLAKQPLVASFTVAIEIPAVWPLSQGRTTASPSRAIQTVDPFRLEPQSTLLYGLSPAAGAVLPPTIPLVQGRLSGGSLSAVIAVELYQRVSTVQPVVAAFTPLVAAPAIRPLGSPTIPVERFKLEPGPRLLSGSIPVAPPAVPPNLILLLQGQTNAGALTPVRSLERIQLETGPRLLQAIAPVAPPAPPLTGPLTLWASRAAERQETLRRTNQPVVGRIDPAPPLVAQTLLLQGQTNRGSLAQVTGAAPIEVDTASRLLQRLIPSAPPSGPPIQLLVSDQTTVLGGGIVPKVKAHTKPEPQSVGLILGPFEEIRTPAIVPLLPGRLSDGPLSGITPQDPFQIQLPARTITGAGQPVPVLPPVLSLLAGQGNVRGPLVSVIAVDLFQIDRGPRYQIGFGEPPIPPPPIIPLASNRPTNTSLSATVAIELVQVDRGPRTLIGAGEPPPAPVPVLLLVAGQGNVSGPLTATIAPERIERVYSPQPVIGRVDAPAVLSLLPNGLTGMILKPALATAGFGIRPDLGSRTIQGAGAPSITPQEETFIGGWKQYKKWPLPPPHFPLPSEGQAQVLSFGDTPATEHVPTWTKPSPGTRKLVYAARPYRQSQVIPPTPRRASLWRKPAYAGEPIGVTADEAIRSWKRREEENIVLALILNDKL